MIELTVIIPTRNRHASLKLALQSLSSQTFHHSRFEVIVVDNGPSCKSAEVTKDFLCSIGNLFYAEEPSPGLHNARHRGMREARTDRLVFVDDDIEAFPGWLEGVWEGFAHHGAVMVGGKNLPKWGSEPPDWLMRLWTAGGEDNRSLGYLSILDFGDSVRDIDPSYIWGCNFAIQRSVLLAAGGFHPDAMPDDLLKFRGDGESHVSRYVAAEDLKAVYNPKASVYHNVPDSRMTLNYFRKRAFRQGVSDSYSRLRKDPLRIKGIVVTSHPLRAFMSFAPLRQLLSRLLPAGVALRANVNEAYWSGFRWHEHLFRNDESVRKWVLRKNYLDA